MKKIFLIAGIMGAFTFGSLMTSCGNDDEIKPETEKQADKEKDPAPEIPTESENKIETLNAGSGATYATLWGWINKDQLSETDYNKAKTGFVYSFNIEQLKKAIKNPQATPEGVTAELVDFSETSNQFFLELNDIDPDVTVFYAAIAIIGNKFIVGEIKNVRTKSLTEAVEVSELTDGPGTATIKCKHKLTDGWIEKNVKEFGIEYRMTSTGSYIQDYKLTPYGTWCTALTTVKEKNETFNYSKNAPYYQCKARNLIEGKTYEFRTYIKTNDGKLFRSGSKTLTLAVKQPVHNARTFNFKLNGKDLSITMIGVTGGIFDMGSNTCDISEKPVHKVNLSTFFISNIELQAEFLYAALGDNIYQYDQKRTGEILNIKNAQKVCDLINEAMQQQGCHAFFRLPTEAEWEYAARGGIFSKGYTYAGGNTLSEVARTYHDQPEGSVWPGIADPAWHLFEPRYKKANELGIYDMSGNGAEFVIDQAYAYDSRERTNPIFYNPQSTTADRLVRGFSAEWSTVKNTSTTHPGDYYYQIPVRLTVKHDISNMGFGLRLVCSDYEQ